MTTEQRVLQAYQVRGPMTIGECKQATGLHSECIRPVVKAPTFRPVGWARVEHGRARVWALDAPVSTLTALDDGGTVHRRDGSDPWPGVVVAEAG